MDTVKLLSQYMTKELLAMDDAHRYAAIVATRDAVMAEARRKQRALTRWADLQLRRMAAQGMSPEQIAAAVKSAGGKLGVSTVRRALKKDVSKVGASGQ